MVAYCHHNLTFQLFDNKIAASFIGAQRRGILRVLLLSSLLERSTCPAFCIRYDKGVLICTCQGAPPTDSALILGE